MSDREKLIYHLWYYYKPCINTFTFIQLNITVVIDSKCIIYKFLTSFVITFTLPQVILTQPLTKLNIIPQHSHHTPLYPPDQRYWNLSWSCLQLEVVSSIHNPVRCHTSHCFPWEVILCLRGLSTPLHILQIKCKRIIFIAFHNLHLY